MATCTQSGGEKMPAIPAGMKQLSTQIPESVYSALVSLCAITRRSIAAEVQRALERHLESPPRVVESPIFPEVIQPTIAATNESPKRLKRGRPKKNKE